MAVAAVGSLFIVKVKVAAAEKKHLMRVRDRQIRRSDIGAFADVTTARDVAAGADVPVPSRDESGEKARESENSHFRRHHRHRYAIVTAESETTERIERNSVARARGTEKHIRPKTLTRKNPILYTREWNRESRSVVESIPRQRNDTDGCL